MKKILMILIFSAMLITPAHAQSIESEAAQTGNVYAVENELDDEQRKITGNLIVDGKYDTEGALERLFKALIAGIKEELHNGLDIFARLSAVCFLCAFCSAMDGEKRFNEYISLAACCVTALMLIGEAKSIGSEALESIGQLSDYSKAALPAVFTAAAAGGTAVSAGAKYAASCFALNIIMSLSQTLIVPAIYSYLALSVSASIYDNTVVQTCISFCKWLTTVLLTALAIVFSSYLTLTGIIAGSTDAVAVKTVRTVMSRSLPVVGGLISDSASIVLAAANVIKSSAGVFSLIAVCAICIGPVAKLFVRLVLLRAAESVCVLVPGGKCTALVKNINNAMGMMLGLLGCYALIIFVSVTSAIKTVAV